MDGTTRFSATLLIAGVLACHPHAGVEHGPASRNVITSEEIEASQAKSVYELIARTHAEFFRDRGVVSVVTQRRTRAVIFMNDQEYGEIEVLRNVPVERLSAIYFFSGPEAVAKFGAQYGSGVIQLIPRYQ